ncbi:MAG: hypothetical protein QNJ69_12835 [Gammaproteobacteria bacterium]|nr:hypothetical protein [Gammaproteobacteria bacterium]
MRKFFILLFISYLSGCASGKYGYSDGQWQALSQQQRDAVIAEVEENIRQNKEAIHEQEMTNQNLNHISGSRSNDFHVWPGSPRRSLYNLRQ